MNKQTLQSLPYIAQAPWYIRILGVPVVGAILAGLWPSPTPVAYQIWQQNSWLVRLGMVVASIILPIGAASLLFEKTLFSRTNIEHRTKFLRKLLKPYSDVESLVYESKTLGRPESLKIIFSDNSKISITSGQAEIGVIIEILKSHIDHHVTIKHR